MIKFEDVRKEWEKDPDFKEAYEAERTEFSLASELIRARAAADMTQEDVAKAMQTSQSYIAKLEGGRVSPSMKALKRFAEATGARLQISLVTV